MQENSHGQFWRESAQTFAIGRAKVGVREIERGITRLVNCKNQASTMSKAAHSIQCPHNLLLFK